MGIGFEKPRGVVEELAHRGSGVGVLEARDVIRGRVVEPEEALVGEHPHGGGSDDLGEREPEVGRLRCGRRPGGEVRRGRRRRRKVEPRAVEMAIEAPGIA